MATTHPADAGPSRAEPRPAHDLYDAHRDRYYAKPLLRGWSHLLWFEASLVCGTLLIVAARGAVEVFAVTVYAVTVSGLFGTSALYHRGNWGPRASRNLQRADQLMIFMSIAGTATPAFLVGAPGGYGLTCVIIMWTVTAAAVTLRMLRLRTPERVAGAMFVGLGLLGALALPPVWRNGGVAVALLLISGGACYLGGALAYHRRRPDPAPAVFGYHEVFHAFVCAAATFQFVGIALLIR